MLDKSKKRQKAPAGQRTCVQCKTPKPVEEMVSSGHKLCLECHRDRVEISKAKKAESEDVLDVEPIAFNDRDLSQAFENREELSKMLKGNLQEMLNQVDRRIIASEARLRAAEKKKSEKAINDASRALDNAITMKIGLTTRLVEKLEAMEDLRAKEEKAKPVTFFLVNAPDRPNLIPVRVVPPELFPVVVPDETDG